MAASDNHSPSTAAALPADVVVTYPPELPVSQRKDDILAAIRENQVVIIAGATGSGKTTQLPKILLELGRTSIGHTQPRRIAARTVAERIAEELGTELGDLVGYQVRFTDRVGKNTRIKLMTDGILLNEIHRDRDLKKYDAIIIDEAHERSLTVDFLLGYLKQLRARRPDLSIIITSATIDPESFSKHFDNAPIIEVSGRTFPVEIRYRPLVAEENTGDELKAEDAEEKAANRADRDYLQGINDALDELARESDGDVLVFLSGETEIRDAEEAIRGRISGGGLHEGTEVLPLYGRLSAAEQHRVFESRRPPGTRRRIVLATNVAETSLTVPGIRYVIDAGTARISRYSTRAKIQRLPIEAISQASANQRSGRSGRTSNGIAIRLYSEEDFTSRPEFTEPEILRTNLAAVILQMVSLGLGNIAEFPFLQPPDSRGIKDGLALLTELGAVENVAGIRSTKTSSSVNGPRTGAKDAAPRITRIGKQLTQLPIDPRLARMVIESKHHSTTREVMAIVAALSIQDPRERPLDKRPQADQQHARFIDPTSDFLTLLNLWNYLEEKRKELSGNQFRRLCKNEYLNYLRVREWHDVYRQLSRMAKPLGLVIGDAHSNPDGIHRSLLAGLLSHIGLKDVAKRDYIGARQTRFVIFPGSALAKKQPNAIMSAELVETSRLFARTNAAIDPVWAEKLAGDLVKRSYSEPHWEKKQGAAVAFERATLYGVTLAARRRIQFSRVDLPAARELFIRHALVEGEDDLTKRDKRVWGFDASNRALRRDLEQLEERSRRRDILHDDETIFEFYDKRIPTTVASVRDFEGWWKKARHNSPDLLTLTTDDLLENADDAEVDETAFPTTWVRGDQTLNLTYRFEPGTDDDGVTVAVPLPLLAGLRPEGFDWQVPGLREELVTALIKSLPKPIRRNVVPAADWARRLLEETPTDPATAALDGGPGLTEYLAKEITRLTYVKVTATDFDLDRVPSHLKVTFAVINERGKKVGANKSLRSLQASLKPAARESVARAVEGATRSATGGAVEHPSDSLERSGITAWDFGSLDRSRNTTHGGNTIRAYPALVDDGDSVSIRLMSTPHDQAIAHHGGVRRLLLLATPSPLGYINDHLTGNEKLVLAQSPYRSTNSLFEDCLRACIDSVMGDRDVFEQTEFEALRNEISAGLVDSLFATVSLVASIISGVRLADKAIRAATSMHLIAPLGDAREQLAALVYPGFVSATGLTQLRRLPVYLKGIEHRITKLTENPGRDRGWMSEVELATRRYTDAGGTLPLEQHPEPQLARARWMLEELRLSLFAQHLGTAESVSLQRIAKVLAT